MRGTTSLLLLLALTSTQLPSALACDSDADCGAGGTCIKRERRASGVCYGGRFDVETPQSPPAADGGTVPRPVTGERREVAKQWLGDPEKIIKENLPNAETGAVCMVDQDCPDGLSCVIAGFEGRCVRFN